MKITKNEKELIEDQKLERCFSPKIDGIRKLFPEVITENGLIDFEKLKHILGEKIDFGKERFSMNWPGKASCISSIQEPSNATLLPLKSESISFDEAENVLIGGDNLEVLKLLQKAYLNSVKLIYIDPPYNTGNDFIYPDNYAENITTYLEYTGQIDSHGKKFGTNTDLDGRYHSKWLNMIYPRLYLARNLLSDEGAIFISIDERELANLKKVCDEIFGEENFQAIISWQKRYTRSNNTTDFTTMTEYLVVYAKSEKFKVNLLPRSDEADARYTNPDNDPRGPWKGASFLNPKSPKERPNLAYDLVNPFTKSITKPTTHAWRRAKEEMEKLHADNRLYWGADNKADVPTIKSFLSEARGMTPVNFWPHDYAGNTDEGTRDLEELLGEKIFDNPKPVQLIKRVIEHVCNDDSIVLDFFAGSGTVGQAVHEMNAQNGSNLKYILVQLPEPTDRSSYTTIFDVTKERIKRTIQKIRNDNLEFKDVGFRCFKLSDSNFLGWEKNTAHEVDQLTKQLEFHIDHVKHERTSDDILFEILLKSGFPLTTKVENQKFGTQTVYSIAGGMLLVCLEDNLTLELIKQIAEQKPDRVVCLDHGFANNDQLKANAVQIFRTKGIASFKTV